MVIKAGIGNQDTQASQALSFGFTAVGPVTLLALIFSVFHLGDPIGAPRSLFNLGSSWLSREILTCSAFLILWIVFWWLSRKGKEVSALGWLTAFVGLTVIFSMSNIYSSSVRPAWDNSNTFVAFFGATLAMGVLGAISVVAFAMKGNTYSAVLLKTLKNMAYIGALGIVLPLLNLPLFISGLKSSGSTAETSAQILTGNMGVLAVSSMFLLLGIALLLHSLYKEGAKPKRFAGIIYLALALIIAGEAVSRYLFYAIGVSPMIGG
jgi:anaerobic dimethyl sulfoxide reductase subunit C (anchor subunit)